MAMMSTGMYQTACEASPNKNQIDAWLNEGKSCMEISRLLQSQFDEKISDRSVSKYKRYREEFIRKQLETNPDYVGKMQMLESTLNDSIASIEQVDAIAELTAVINDSAELLAQARGNITIKSAQDWRFVSQTLLDAIKIHADTILKAQRFAKIDEDPSLLKPTTINVNIKSTLADIIGKAMNENGYGLIDQLRAGLSGTVSADAVQVEDGDENNGE